MTSSVEDFLSGGKTSRFPKIVAWGDKPVGTTIGGVIIDEPEMTQQTDMETREPAFFPENDKGERHPKMQLLVPIQAEPNPAIEDDDGKLTLAVRGGFGYESSRKGLIEELKRNDLASPRVGDAIWWTRIANRKGPGFVGRTHQAKIKYVKREDFGPEENRLLALVDGSQEAPAPKKRAAPKKKAAPAEEVWE